MKKIVAMMLAAVMVLMLFAGCGAVPATNDGGNKPAEADAEKEDAGDEAEAESSDLPKVTVEVICGSVPSETESIQAAISEITKEYGFVVELLPIEIGNAATQLNLLLSGGDDTLDIYTTIGVTYNTVVNNGQALELTDLLKDYEAEMKTALTESVYNSGYLSGKLYGVGRLLDQASTPCYSIRADIAEQYGYKNGDKIDLDILTELFAKIRADYPDIPLIGPNNGQPNIGDSRVDALNNKLGVLGNYGQDETVIDYYSSDYFKELCGYFEKWRDAGYYMSDILNVADTPSDYIAAGKCFGCFASHFSAEMNGIWSTSNFGCDVASLQIYEDATAVSPGAYFCINPACKNPDKAATMLYLMATNADIVNLMINGIEGQDYIVLDDGSATFVEGKDTASTGWALGFSWANLNSSISIPFNYPADYYKQMLDANASAKQSKAFGCQFDLTSVADEVSACTNVVNKYFNALEGGAVEDYTATLDAFIEELKASGIDKIVECKQQQLDAFLGK